MKHKLLLIFLMSLFSPSLVLSEKIASAPSEIIKMPENDQFAIKEALIDRDWQSVQMFASKSGTFAIYDAQKIRDFLIQYDQCHKEPESPPSCYSKVQNKWNDLPDTTVLGVPTANFLNTLHQIFIDDFNKAIQREKQKKEKESEKGQPDQKHPEGGEEEKPASEAAERFRRRQEEEHALKTSEAHRQRNAAACSKIAGQTAEETKIVGKVTDGKELNSLVIGYLIMKSKQKPPAPECDLPHVLEAAQSPSYYRGRPVEAYGKIIGLQIEKRELAGSNEYIAAGIIEWENNPTYFFSPGKAPGFNKGDYIFIEGYFVQNYSYETKTGGRVTVPVIAGRLRK